jgi:hypothetical protein
MVPVQLFCLAVVPLVILAMALDRLFLLATAPDQLFILAVVLPVKVMMMRNQCMDHRPPYALDMMVGMRLLKHH